ncbi:MAG: YigZ family protein, partial [Bacteroidia bacterium]|nr:YigZ family protein [Bacteroidia bacterium]
IQLRKEHPSAVHFCYAFFIGTNQEGYRSNDDGEPAGSAGKPILNQLKSFGLTNVLVVVVRYFGGTLLGVPGLINAYKESTRLALAEATVVERFVQEVYEVKVNYPQLNTLLKYIREENAIVIKQAMDLEVSIIFSVRKSLADTLIKKINKIENSMLTYQKII